MENKVRVIAILDYFSQECLKPLHNYLGRVLRNIPQDCTYDQGSFKFKLDNSEEDFYSVDLKSATDRFPIQVIEMILKGKFPSHYVDAWHRIMVGHPFEITLPHGTEKVSYGVGNPMGAYSSFASFALANHYVIYYCCRKLGKNWKSLRYCVLGDDVVIRDKAVGELYISTMQSLGVEISGVKTHKSKHFVEFAKRMIYKGQEISPYPISSIKETKKRYYLLLNTIMEIEGHEWHVRESIPRAVELFYEYVVPRRKRFRSKIKNLTEVSELITRVMRESLSAEIAINGIIRCQGLPIPEMTHEESVKILSAVTRECFEESHPLYAAKPGKKPLGQLAQDYLIRLTADERFYSVLSSAAFEASHIPILQVYGQVEEKYLRIHKEGLDLMNLDSDWPLTLRSMTLPSSDDVFIMKNKDLRSRASAIFGTKVVNKLRSLCNN
jgi:hypothetical protein